MNDIALQQTPVLVVGAGIMGTGIAQVAAQAGHAVLLHDSREGAAAAAKGKLATTLDGLVARGKLAADAAQALLGRIQPIHAVEEAHGAGLVVGMTTYMHIDAVHQRVEIGSTWYALGAQRTPLNTDAKRLLLAHAFEQLHCIAVEFRSHRLNTPSRLAIERLGAQLDGMLRSHQRAADGSLRDTAIYSVTAAEWPAVRAHLDWQLNKPRAA